MDNVDGLSGRDSFLPFLESINSRVESLTNELMTADYYNNLNKDRKLTQPAELQDAFDRYINITEFFSLSIIAYLDISSALNLIIKSNIKWDVIFGSKYLYLTIYEVMKKIPKYSKTLRKEIHESDRSDLKDQLKDLLRNYTDFCGKEEEIKAIRHSIGGHISHLEEYVDNITRISVKESLDLAVDFIEILTVYHYLLKEISAFTILKTLPQGNNIGHK